MGFTKDLWYRTVEDPEGNESKERTNRYGRGKRWLAVWHDPDGRECSKAFDKKVDADNTWAAQETDVIRGDYIDPKAGRVLFGSLAKRWLQSRVVDPATAIRYESVYRLHVEPVFGRRQVKGIKPSEIAEWLTTLVDRYSASLGRTALLVIMGVLDLAVEDGALKKNPARSKVVPRPKDPASKVVAWSDDQVESVVDNHPLLFRPVPVIGAGCGPRQAEIFALSEEDIDYDEKVIHIRRQLKNLNGRYVFALPKYDKERIVPLPDWVAHTTKAHTKVYPPLPCTLPWEKVDGRPVTVNLMFRWTDDKHIRARGYDLVVWKPTLVRAGVIPPPTKGKRGRLRYVADHQSGMHALRHYYASVTLADGVNIKELAEYLGHADPGFTLRVYAHMLPSSHERARMAIDNRWFKPRAVRSIRQSRRPETTTSESDGTVTEQRPTGEQL